MVGRDLHGHFDHLVDLRHPQLAQLGLSARQHKDGNDSAAEGADQSANSESNDSDTATEVARSHQRLAFNGEDFGKMKSLPLEAFAFESPSEAVAANC